MVEKKAEAEERTKAEVLRERLLYAAGKYSDYSRFECNLKAVEEEYDETLELYNIVVWQHESEGTIRDKAAAMLHVTAELFNDLVENAERELYYVMREIVESDEDSQKKICGVVIQKDIFTEEEFQEMLTGWCEYEYVQDEALKAFLKVLGEWKWGEREEEQF